MTVRMVFLMTLILCSGRGFGQRGVIQGSGKREGVPRPVYLETRDGNAVRGFYLGTRGDTLVLLHRGAETAFPFGDLRQVRMEGVRSSPMATVLPAAVIGGYAVAGLLSGSSSVPFGFLAPYTDAKAPILFGIAAGFAVGYIASLFVPSSSGPTELFLFGQGTDQEESTIEEFRSFLTPGQKTARFHLTLHGGSVSTRSASSVNPAQYNYNQYWGSYHDSYEYGTVNFLRRVQCSYSILPAIDVGIAIVRITEPTMRLWYGASTGSSSEYGSYEESLKGTAFLVVGEGQPLKTILPEELSWKIDLGIGFAPVTFTSSARVEMRTYNPYSNQVIQDQTGFDETRLGLMIGTTVDLFVYDHFSIGFSGEYTLAVGSSLPAVPTWDIPARWCGNSCLGVNLGLHF